MKRGKMKAQIWVSAVLYIALGTIIIALILSAGVPLINKLRDKNTVVQTKNLLYTIDNNIKEVAREGPGSKRFLSPLNIEEGKLNILSADNKINWNLKTKNKMAEPNIVFYEGALALLLEETIVEDEYVINLELYYDNFANINLESPYSNPFVGTYSMTIEHAGIYSNNPEGCTSNCNCIECIPNIIIKIN